MKKLIFTIFFTFGFIFCSNAQNYLIKAYYDSDKLSAEWGNYTENPSSENALKVYNLLPKKGHVRKEDSNIELNNLIYENLNIISNQILQGDKNNVKLAFRLFTISDGAFSEELQIMLGQLVKINPELFLTELKEHFHLIDRLGSLVCNYGSEFVDNRTKQKAETDERIIKLKTIEKTELIKTRDKCLTELSKKLKMLNNLIEKYGSK